MRGTADAANVASARKGPRPSRQRSLVCLTRNSASSEVPARNGILKTIFEVLLLVVVFISTLVGYYWLLTHHFALSKEAATLFLAPVALLGGLTAIYSYYLGWLRYHRGTQTTSIRDDPHWHAFEQRFRIFVFGLILVLPSALALFSLLALRDLAVTALSALVAAAIAPWTVRKIRAEARNRSK